MVTTAEDSVRTWSPWALTHCALSTGIGNVVDGKRGSVSLQNHVLEIKSQALTAQRVLSASSRTWMPGITGNFYQFPGYRVKGLG